MSIWQCIWRQALMQCQAQTHTPLLTPLMTAMVTTCIQQKLQPDFGHSTPVPSSWLQNWMMCRTWSRRSSIYQATPQETQPSLETWTQIWQLSGTGLSMSGVQGLEQAQHIYQATSEGVAVMS